MVPGDNTAALLASMASSSMKTQHANHGVNGGGGTFDTTTNTAADEEKSAQCSRAANNVYQTFRCAGRLLVSPQFDGHEYRIPGSIFCKEYVKLTGTRLDHEALGFNALSDFIRSIPWVRITCMSDPVVFIPSVPFTRDAQPMISCFYFVYLLFTARAREGGKRGYN